MFNGDKIVNEHVAKVINETKYLRDRQSERAGKLKSPTEKGEISENFQMPKTLDDIEDRIGKCAKNWKRRRSEKFRQHRNDKTCF